MDTVTALCWLQQGLQCCYSFRSVDENSGSCSCVDRGSVAVGTEKERSDRKMSTGTVLMKCIKLIKRYVIDHDLHTVTRQFLNKSNTF